MEEDFTIELQDEEAKESCKVIVPKNSKLVGRISNNDVRVYIRQDVYYALEAYAKADVGNERGTIILGDYIEDDGIISVIISDYIEGRYAESSISTFTFTHETWNFVHSQHDKLYPEKKIVGWQHTHPGFGIFLSSYDMFIQENYFNMPFQVAYVIDPLQDLNGFFQWKDGKVEKLSGFYVYDDTGKKIRLSSCPSDKKKRKAVKKTNVAEIIALLVSLAIAVTSFFMFLNLRNSENKQKSTDTSYSTAQAIHSNITG